MCGIFACSLTGGKNITNSKQQAFEALKLLEYRGYDSFGIYSTISAPNLGGVRGGENLEKHVGAVSNVKIKFSSKDKFNISLGHTRWATHGKVSNENTHPHLSNNKNFVIVHNGIFENYEEVKKELLKNKYKFYGETDTKILVNYFEYSKNKNEIEKFKKNVKGSSAFVIYSKNENKFYIYKNGSALYIAQDENKNLYISSDVSTLVEYTKNIYSLKDGTFLEIDLNPTEEVFQKFIKNNLIEKINIQNVKPVFLGKFKNWTIKEIYDQKDTIKNAYENIGENILEKVKIENLKSKNIIFTGCGTAYNVCLAAKYLFAKKGININVIPANEYQSFSNLLNKNTLLFAISQSGETADTIIFAKKVIENGGEVFSILNNVNSTLAQISKVFIDIDSGKEIAVASTKAFTAQIAAILKILDFKIEEKTWEDLNKIFNKNIYSQKLEKEIKNVAQKIVKKYKAENLFLIGKGLSSTIGTEVSLKIKETSYIHTESFAAGELKHGVLSLIEKNVITIVLDADKEFEGELENSATQIKSRDGVLIGIGINNKKYYDHFLQIPDLGGYTFLGATIVGQMLAYYIAINKNLNPDKPRNLAKSVTVK